MWFNRNKDEQERATIHWGARAERHAERYLTQQGLVTRAKNYRAKPGEIDLIMAEDETLVFVEVRLRSNPHFSSAAETINYPKQQKIIRTAQHFLQQHHLTDKIACRFDVIAITKKSNHSLALEWIKNAFGV